MIQVAFSKEHSGCSTEHGQQGGKKVRERKHGEEVGKMSAVGARAAEGSQPHIPA